MWAPCSHCCPVHTLCWVMALATSKSTSRLERIPSPQNQQNSAIKFLLCSQESLVQSRDKLKAEAAFDLTPMKGGIMWHQHTVRPESASFHTCILLHQVWSCRGNYRKHRSLGWGFACFVQQSLNKKTIALSTQWISAPDHARRQLSLRGGTAKCNILLCTCSIWSEYVRNPSRQAEVSIKISDSVEACACCKGVGLAWHHGKCWPSAELRPGQSPRADGAGRDPARYFKRVHVGFISCLILQLWIWYGGFHQWVYPQMVGLYWEIPLEWMMTGVPPFQETSI